MSRQIPLRELAVKALVVILAAGTVGIALKFTTYFEKWVWFPIWPNAVGAAFLIATALTLAYLGLRRQKP